MSMPVRPSDREGREQPERCNEADGKRNRGNPIECRTLNLMLVVTDKMVELTADRFIGREPRDLDVASVS